MRFARLFATLLAPVALLAACDSPSRSFDGPWVVQSVRSEVKTTCFTPDIEDDPLEEPVRQVRIERIGRRLRWTEVDGIIGNAPIDGQIDSDTNEFEVIHRVDNPDRGLPFEVRIEGRFLSSERFESESSRRHLAGSGCSTVWDDVGARP